MDTIGERIRYIRKDRNGLTLDKFGQQIGVSNAAISALESGKNNPSEQTIKLICREFGVNETWLRTGVGEPYAPKSREEELGQLVKSLMTDNSDSFRARLVTALLRLDPNGAEWEALERIYDSVAAEMSKNEDDP